MDRRCTLPVAVLLLVVLSGVTACSSKTGQTSTGTIQPPSAPTSPALPASQPAPAVSQPAPAVSQPAPAPSGGTPNATANASIQTQDTNTSGVAADLIECKRKEGVLSIKVRFRNVSSKSDSFGIFAGRNYETYYLIASNKKYFMLKDSDGTYLTPAADGMGYLNVPLAQGQSYVWWAKYPAPPADVTKIGFFTPVAPPFEDVPISDR